MRHSSYFHMVFWPQSMSSSELEFHQFSDIAFTIWLEEDVLLFEIFFTHAPMLNVGELGAGDDEAVEDDVGIAETRFKLFNFG